MARRLIAFVLILMTFAASPFMVLANDIKKPEELCAQLAAASQADCAAAAKLLIAPPEGGPSPEVTVFLTAEKGDLTADYRVHRTGRTENLSSHLFVEHGADIDAVAEPRQRGETDLVYTPLQASLLGAYDGDVSVARAFLNLGADPHRRDLDGRSTLFLLHVGRGAATHPSAGSQSARQLPLADNLSRFRA